MAGVHLEAHVARIIKMFARGTFIIKNNIRYTVWNGNCARPALNLKGCGYVFKHVITSSLTSSSVRYKILLNRLLSTHFSCSLLTLVEESYPSLLASPQFHHVTLR